MPLFIVLYRLIHDLTATVIAGAVVVGGVGSAPAIANPTVTNVKVDSGTVKAGKLSDSLSGTVSVNDKVVGSLQGAHVTNNVLHGPKKDDPVTVVDAANRPIGTISGATVQGAHVDANPKHIPKDSKLYRDLRKTPGRMVSWGMDLAKRPSQGKGAEAIGLYLLVALTVITGYYQQRQMTARTPAAAQNPQTQMMGRIFPLFFGFISLQVPAGVVLYFVVSNLWQIGQQAIIFREKDATPAQAKPSSSGSSKAEESSGDGGRPAEAAVASAVDRRLVDREQWQQRIGHPQQAPPQAAQREIAVQWVEVTGRTVEEAKEAALDQLGVDEQDAEFEILEEPKSGLFGRLRAEARVRARVVPTAPRPKVERRERKGRGSREAATAEAEADAVTEPGAAAAAEAAAGAVAAVVAVAAKPARADGRDER